METGRNGRREGSGGNRKGRRCRGEVVVFVVGSGGKLVNAGRLQSLLDAYLSLVSYRTMSVSGQVSQVNVKTGERGQQRYNGLGASDKGREIRVR